MPFNFLSLIVISPENAICTTWKTKCQSCDAGMSVVIEREIPLKNKLSERLGSVNYIQREQFVQFS